MTTATRRKKAAPPTGQIQLHASAPVDRIDPHPENIRHDLGDLADLADSIRTHGIIEPLIVFATSDDRWTIIAGHRRLAAAKLAGVDQVPILERAEPDRADLLELMLQENNQRADLDPIDEGRALVEIMAASPGRKLDDLARSVCRSKTWVAERVAIVERLDDPTVHDRIRSGDLPIGEAASIATAKGVKAADRLRIAKLTNRFDRKNQLRNARQTAERDAQLAKAKRAWPGRQIGVAHPDALKGGGIGHARYGTVGGDINTPPEMGDADHQYVRVEYDGSCTVYHLAPQLLDPADFVPFTRPESDVDADDVTELHDLTDEQIERAVLVHRIPEHGPKINHWQRAKAHRSCDGHREVSVPWSLAVVDLCVEPRLHELFPDGDGTLYGPTWPELLAMTQARVESGELRPTSGPGVRPRRERLGAAVYDRLASELADQLADVPPLVLGALMRFDPWDFEQDNDEKTALVDDDLLVRLVQACVDGLVDDLAPQWGGYAECSLGGRIAGRALADSMVDDSIDWPSGVLRQHLYPPTLEDFLGAIAAAVASDDPTPLPGVHDLRQLARAFTDDGWTVDVEADESAATFTDPESSLLFVVTVDVDEPEAPDGGGDDE